MLPLARDEEVEEVLGIGAHAVGPEEVGHGGVGVGCVAEGGGGGGEPVEEGEERLGREREWVSGEERDKETRSER